MVQIQTVLSSIKSFFVERGTPFLSTFNRSSRIIVEIGIHRAPKKFVRSLRVKPFMLIG